jgi:hypothetical protein
MMLKCDDQCCRCPVVRKMNAIQRNLMRYDNTSIHIAVLFIIFSVVVCVCLYVSVCVMN